MPQIIPINWILIILITTIVILITIVIIHNFNLKNNLKSTIKTNNKKIIKNIKW